MVDENPHIRGRALSTPNAFGITVSVSMSKPAPQPSASAVPASRAAHPVSTALVKVPEITALFWVVKILTTAMGESTSDFLNQELGPAIAVPIMLIVLGLALRSQFKYPR